MKYLYKTNYSYNCNIYIYTIKQAHVTDNLACFCDYHVRYPGLKIASPVFAHIQTPWASINFKLLCALGPHLLCSFWLNLAESGFIFVYVTSYFEKLQPLSVAVG